MKIRRLLAVIIGLAALFLLAPYIWYTSLEWGEPVGGTAIFGVLLVNLSMIAMVTLAAFIFALEITAIYILIVRRKEVLEALRRLRRLTRAAEWYRPWMERVYRVRERGIREAIAKLGYVR